MKNIVYILNGKAYVNLTNRCENACSFCIRNTGEGVQGTNLWLDGDATGSEAIAAFENLSEKIDDEVVFCGFGEPTENMDALKATAKYLKANGYKTRLNTNGLGSVSNGRNIVSELGDIDVVSVSLNNCSPEKYAEITNSSYGLDAFGYVVDFARECKAAHKEVVFTVVDVIGEGDVEACRALCEKLDIPLRVRKYIPDNYSDGRNN